MRSVTPVATATADTTNAPTVFGVYSSYCSNHMTVYTKTGDRGQSSAGKKNGKLTKSSAVFDVLGTLDELSSTLGFIQSSKISDIRKITLSVQEDLLTIGAVISGNIQYPKHKSYWPVKVIYFENTIDSLTKTLPTLKSFILVGGSFESGYLHLARVVCRRLERIFVRYALESKRKDLNEIGQYLNRLSDLLFVLARFANKKNKVRDIPWAGLK